MKDSIRLEGMILKLNTSDSMIEWIRKKGSSYEREVIDVMKQKVKFGYTFVDVGAMIGYHTLIASKLVGKEGKVIAFEPAVGNYWVLLQNIENNKLKNVIAINEALSDHNGEQIFYWSPSRQMYRMVDEFKENARITIPCITLDKYLGNQKIDFIKIDVEGAELKVLKGAESILRTQSPFLICEVWNKSPESFMPYLWDLKYDYYPIDYKQGEESYNIFAWKP